MKLGKLIGEALGKVPHCVELVRNWYWGFGESGDYLGKIGDQIGED